MSVCTARYVWRAIFGSDGCTMAWQGTDAPDSLLFIDAMDMCKRWQRMAAGHAAKVGRAYRMYRAVQVNDAVDRDEIEGPKRTDV
jgi:hypothetical protein